MKKILLSLVLLVAATGAMAQKKGTPTQQDVLKTMRKATEFMVEKVSNNGGYLWAYSPDFSRVWGELEAKPSMMWIERGTPEMAHLFLDAYHATGDEYYMRAAEASTAAVIWAQLPCGGWSYMADFAGEESLKDWYKRVKEGYQYCAQEHMHYYGNATFDDGTIDAANLLLRMYTLNYDPKYKPALDKAINFVLESQYPIGGWPQRYPLKYDFVKGDKEDYTSFITINDGVHTGNIHFLLDCYKMLGDSRLLEPISRAMTCILVLQGGKPQAGWAMQHKLDMTYSPGHARDFEPRGYAATATAEMIGNLMNFYRWTGDSKYLSRIPDAFEFLESVKYSDADVAAFGVTLRDGQILCPTFAEVGTNNPLYLHRGEGKYWVDYNPENIITHYRSTRVINIEPLRREYEALIALSRDEATKDSPFIGSKARQERFPLMCSKGIGADVEVSEVSEIISLLRDKDYWPRALPGVSAENPGFSNAPLPTEGIHTWEYTKNMITLINYLKQNK